MSDTIYGVIAGRLLQGAGAVSATLTALLADSTRESVRTRSMAFFGIGIGMAFLLALILGPVIAAVAGTQSLFWLAAGIAVFSAILLSLVPAADTPASPAYSVSIKAAFTPSLLRIDVYVFVLHAMMTSMFVALPFLLQNVLEMNLADHWMIYVGALLASLVGTVPLIISDDRQGKSSVMSIAILLLLAAMLSLVFVPPTKMSVFLSLAVFFAGFNFLEAGLPARLSLLAEGSIRGAAMGVFSSSQFLGAFVGGVMGGLLLASQAGNSVFIAGSVAAVGWLLLHLTGRQT
jgi:predicted MFS family arabinose efflux permease